ncbi:hypothetical protein AB1Y20_003259 [Prymnesium parvum]|uniref:B30.2/SPRY domain-containing protein n=1 Tax=Prymnesium parvum TaxID=97485 RepID=A0AB34JBE5_PRYPA
MESPRTPRSPRLQTAWEQTEDYEVSADRKTATKTMFGYEAGIVTEGELEGEGTFTWTFTIGKTAFEDAHLFVGVADMVDEMAWGFSPPTGSLYHHADKDRWGRETHVRVYAGPSGHALYGNMPGSKVTVIADLTNHNLAFQIHPAGQEQPDDIFEVPVKDCELPDRIKPWAFLGHVGDSVTISDITSVL